jgi:L-fucose mutarotase
MLKNVSPLLTPQLLFGLAKLGHGDDVALVDANFPADRIAEQAHARLVQLPGLSTTQVLQAVLSVLPLDHFDSPCSWTMQVVGDAQAVPPPVAEFKQALHVAGEATPGSLERFAFYEHARSARLVVQTGDLRKYANILLRKGVIATD